jgi:hypothetical protein
MDPQSILGGNWDEPARAATIAAWERPNHLERLSQKDVEIPTVLLGCAVQSLFDSDEYLAKKEGSEDQADAHQEKNTVVWNCVSYIHTEYEVSRMVPKCLSS